MLSKDGGIRTIMDNCIFCKIVNGEIGSQTVYEDEYFKAIMDISPSAMGHVIILSKNHAEDIFEMTEEDLSRGLIVARKVARAVKDATGCDGVNILQNNGKAANQTVFHYHIHVIPRFNDDTIKIKWEPLTVDMDEISVMAEKIREHI